MMFTDLLLKLRVAILRWLFNHNDRKEREQEPRAPNPSFVRSIPSTSPRGSVDLHIYTPPSFRKDGQRTHPVVLNFHGGGFTAGRPSMDARWIATLLASASQPVVIAVDYGLAPETPFPGAIQDAVSAIQWVSHEGADMYSLEPARTVLVGFSAGGSLALAIPLWMESLSNTPPRPLCGVVAIYPGIDYRIRRAPAPGLLARFMRTAWRDAFYRRSPLDSPFVSPAAADDHQLQAALPHRVALYPVANDPLRKETEEFRQRLQRLGKTVTGDTEPSAFHAWDKYTIETTNHEKWSKRESWFARMAKDVEDMLGSSK